MPFTPPYVTAITAGVLVLMQTALMLGVVAARRRNRQSLGDGGQADLVRAIRRHGNLAENAALFVAGFALFELTGGSRRVLVVLCTTFVVGRVSHAIGLSMKNTYNRARVGGVVLTGIVGVTLGWRLIAHATTRLLS
jgi:uncharacterized membrane protein YecN with MAPEG domain